MKNRTVQSVRTVARKITAEARRLGTAWKESQAGTFGASVAYYTIFSIAPLLVIAISIAGLFVDKSQTQASIVQQFSSTFGSSSGNFISSLIAAKASDTTNIVLTIIGFMVLLIGAMGVFTQLQKALNAIFESSLAADHAQTFWMAVRKKFVSLGLVLSMGFVLLTSLALSAFITAFGHHVSIIVAHGEAIAHVLEFLVSFILISFFLSLLYKMLPSKRLSWRSALIGGLVAGILFTISKYLLGLYLGSSTATTGYGGASALVLFVLWIYYMSQVFFLGAILTKLYIIKRGK